MRFGEWCTAVYIQYLRQVCSLSTRMEYLTLNIIHLYLHDSTHISRLFRPYKGELVRMMSAHKHKRNAQRERERDRRRQKLADLSKNICTYMCRLRFIACRRVLWRRSRAYHYSRLAGLHAGLAVFFELYSTTCCTSGFRVSISMPACANLFEYV